MTRSLLITMRLLIIPLWTTMLFVQCHGHGYNISGLLQDYAREVSPSPSDDPHGPVIVTINMEINNLGPFKIHEMEFRVALTLREEWVDPRLVIPGQNKTVVLTYYKERLWIPDIFFPHSIDGKLLTTTTPNHLIWLKPGGNVIYTQKITVDISYPLDLKYFPMDEQVLSVDLSSYSHDVQSLQLKWKYGNDSTNNVQISQSLTLNEFHLEEYTTTHTSVIHPIGKFSCLRVKLYVIRNLSYYLIHNYIPTCLIVSISWLSFLIDYTSAPARISLCLLSVLTLISQTSIIIQDTPKVSYIKALDLWSFISLAFVTIAFLEFAFINAWCREGEKPLFRYAKRLTNAGTKLINIGNKRAARKEETPHDMNERDEKYDFEEDQSVPDENAIRKSLGYRIDGIFFCVYPILFLMFNIFYWSFYGHYFYTSREYVKSAQ